MAMGGQSHSPAASREGTRPVSHFTGGRSGLIRLNLAHTGIRIPNHLARTELLEHAHHNCSRIFSILFLPLLPQFQVPPSASCSPATSSRIRRHSSPFVPIQIIRSLSSRYVTSFSGLQSSRNAFRAL